MGVWGVVLVVCVCVVVAGVVLCRCVCCVCDLLIVFNGTPLGPDDLLATFRDRVKKELPLFARYAPRTPLTEAAALAPFFFDRPWSRLLANKTVAIVHPFAQTIRCQLRRRRLLFEQNDVLPASTRFKLVPMFQVYVHIYICIHIYIYIYIHIRLTPEWGAGEAHYRWETTQLRIPGGGIGLAFTRYCHCQYCVVYIAITGGREKHHSAQ